MYGVARRDEKGSITFEAALTMPVILLFIFVFYILLIVCSAQMALQSLASSTVKQFSSHIHPIYLLIQETKQPAQSEQSKEITDSSWQEVVYELSDLLPAPMDELIQEALKGNWWPTINLATSFVGREVLEPFVRKQSSSQVLRPEHIHLVYLQFPDLLNNTTYHFGVTLEYELPLKIPFTNTPIIVREHAMQRVWMPDARAADYALIAEDPSQFIYIIGIEPNPVKPGHKATLKALTTPNKQLSLEIMYKSGKSVARNLGMQSSNSEGEIEWTWHVSGNTTPGEWELKISSEDDALTMVKSFTVAKSGGGGK